MNERFELQDFDPEKDFPGLLSLDFESFPKDFWTEEFYKEQFAKYPWSFKIIKYQDKIIGYFYDAIYEGDLTDGSHAIFGEISSIAVDPSYRKDGLGSMIFKNAIEELKNMGASRILIHTRVDNFPMQGLAKKFGFKTIGISENYYDDSDAFEMELKE